MKGIIVNYCIDAGLENRVKALREEEKLERIRLKKIKEKRWAEKAEERRKKREIWLEKEKIRLAKEALERKRQNSANKIQQLRKSFKLRKEISNRIEIRRRRYFASSTRRRTPLSLSQSPCLGLKTILKIDFAVQG